MIAFTMHASAYAPSSHLVFHSLWQVGMSLGTVMTDSLCLPKVWLEKPTLAALLWGKKEKQDKKKKERKKQTAHVHFFESHNKFSMERQIICLPDVRIPSGDQQAIPCSSPNPFIRLSWKKRQCHLFVTCHTSSGNPRRTELLGHVRVSLLYICDKVRSSSRDIVLGKSLITFERLNDDEFVSQGKKNNNLWEKPDLYFFVQFTSASDYVIKYLVLTC